MGLIWKFLRDPALQGVSAVLSGLAALAGIVSVFWFAQRSDAPERSQELPSAPISQPAQPPVAKPQPSPAEPTTARETHPVSVPAPPQVASVGLQAPVDECAGVKVPITIGRLVTTKDRMCALAACTGSSIDAPAVQALRRWLTLSDPLSRSKCALADREAMTDNELRRKLFATINAPTDNSAGKDCDALSQALIESVTSLSLKLRVDSDAWTGCSSTTLGETTDEVRALVEALQ